MSNNWACVLAAAVLLSAAPAAAQSTVSSRQAETLDYVVRPGDTLIDLASAYMNRPLDYRRVQRENRVANPRRLSIGRTLALPVDLLRADPDEARIAGFRGAVSLNQDGVSGAPTSGQIVRESAVLSTGANAFVRLALSDGSHVVVPSNSRVRVSRLRRYAINGAVDHALTVEAGRAESRVTPRTRPGGFAIRTPVSVSAVRGTDFRVSFDEASERSATEVLEGAVAVASGKDEALAAADQGVSAAAGAVRLLPLLPAPALARPDAPQTQPQVVFEVQPLPGAERYRGRIAQDAGMIESFAEADSAPGGPLAFGDMEEGAYFLRLTALSPEGLEGKATTYSFIRARNGVGGLASAMDQRDRRRFYRFRWEAEGVGEASFRFQLWREAEDGGVDGPLLVDQPGLTDEAFTLSDLPSGVYSWRVQSARHRFGRLLEAWSEPQQLHIGR
ncbi:FecR domain-containing protein [Brevundimonas diminuta]|uniref:FecR domain-containing protein n=1 Tax=Brevundimonas diminuta TaxID=293 RepID=UPI0020975D3E|nr:FecR domain-containing protein [Brevundimonas diminuta]MCO8017338.1 FecR domain-containing protein [Brevundimonas diminuta]MCO8020858.1 FecR domain-containing protein [Brevundimonas diminuta]